MCKVLFIISYLYLLCSIYLHVSSLFLSSSFALLLLLLLLPLIKGLPSPGTSPLELMVHPTTQASVSRM